MRRTNIYLGDEQSLVLSRAAAELGLSRAELVRRFVDRGLAETEPGDLEADLAAIRQSFGALSRDDVVLEREPGDRGRHLDDMWRL